ncbi:MAG TPA: HNH endonuclease [Vicinamibacterales bacterium]
MKVSTLRLALATDRRARKTGELWVTRCLHCRAQVGLTASGAPIGTTTIEHIVPRSWFGHPAAADLVAIVGSPDDPRNLALACARCNQQKGRTHDARGPRDARAREVVRALLHARLERFVQMEEEGFD